MTDPEPSTPSLSFTGQEFPNPPASMEKPHGIFRGRFGLRAGWGIAIFLLVWFLFTLFGDAAALVFTGQLKSFLAAHAAAQIHPNSPEAKFHLQMFPAISYGQDGIGLLGMLGFCLLFSKLERRPFSAFGLGSKRWRDVIPGALWGVAIMSALIAVLRIFHLLVFDGRALSGISILIWGVKWLVAYLLVGLAEEYAFRGYLQYSLMRGCWGIAEKISPSNPQAVAFWIAGILTSLLFTVGHLGNSGENFFGLLQVFLAGVSFVYGLWRTGSLWWVIGFHATWDWSQSFLYGVADSGAVSVGRLFVTHPIGNPVWSGGTVGPEGSILSVFCLLLTILVLSFVRRGELPSPEQLPPEQHSSPEKLPPNESAAIA